MKLRIHQFAARIDALTLRERGLMFAAAVAVTVFAAHTAVLGPMYRAQDALRGQISQQRNNMIGMDEEIAARVQAYQVDPDAPARARLGAIRQETARLSQALLAMEHGLVPPERMGPLVDAILRANGRLKLVSMRTLPVEPLAASSAPQPDAVPDADRDAARPADLLYRHGVEVTVRGNYLDMVDYMSALEAMPTRLFWGKAQLDVEDYPSSRLTLTLHTLSLDRKWMKL
ncbi:hypothetical protein [Massilia niastensis]|uniref:hypothetical protein n=1 Tax=Massilia niastensis TaxID=544911 RepID=UPI0003787AF3|nr:hypothetical protein [Massilia niastensis]